MFGAAGTGFREAGKAPALSGTSLAISGNATVGGTLGVTGITTLSAALKVPNGSAAAPSILFGALTDGGLFAAADRVGLSFGGAAKLIAQATGARAQSNVFISELGFYNPDVFRWDAEAVKTADYSMQSTDGIVIMNDGGGAALTLTLKAAPPTSDTVLAINIGTSALTIGRASKTINGVAADGSIPAGAARFIHYNGTGFYL